MKEHNKMQENTEENYKGWTGSKRAVFVCNGAKGHAQEERAEYDYYASDPSAATWLMEIEPQITNIYEPCVGEGHLAKEFNKAGKLKAVSDLIDRGYYPEGIPAKYGLDFLKMDKVWKGDMATNPPFKDLKEWVKHSLDCITEGHYLALFMKITFLEGKSRKAFFEKYPPIRVWVSSSRIPCARNGEFEQPKKDKEGNVVLDEAGNPIMQRQSSAACYCWFIWQKGYKGPTELKWFN